MELQFTPEFEKKLNDLATETGIPAATLVQDALVGMFDELAPTKDMLDRRYDEIKSGKVKLIPGEEVKAYFREKYATALREQSGS